MIELKIDNPEIEKFFEKNEDIIKALNFIVQNNIDFKNYTPSWHINELEKREKEFFKNPKNGKNWDNIKAKYI